MIIVKNKRSIEKMIQAGGLLAGVFESLNSYIRPGVTTLEIDSEIVRLLKASRLLSQTVGYAGYQHASCISVNHEVVHGVPSSAKMLKDGDLVKVDICASYDGYCADMARPFFVGQRLAQAEHLVLIAQSALDLGIKQAVPGNRVHDISHAIQTEVEKYGYGVVRDFAGHGIGKRMHEDPEVPNYGKPGTGPLIYAGMSFAIEPMITLGGWSVGVCPRDKWTVTTKDGSLSAHVEDTVVVLDNGPYITTRR